MNQTYFQVFNFFANVLKMTFILNFILYIYLR